MKEKAPLPENQKAESEYSPEIINHKIEELLLSCERAGEGGKAVVLKIAVDQVPETLDPALDALKVAGSDAAVKLFKLYLPNKGAWEYKMHQRAYEAIQAIPEEERSKFALIPALSSIREITLEENARKELEEKFSASIAGGKNQLIAMEYINGEDIATIFYKWILERENRFTAEEVDAMDFKKLYEEISFCLRFESLPEEGIDDPRALELAEWKNSAKNTGKLYDYLKKHKFPFPAAAVAQVENTLNGLHRANILHGDAFERNIMITGGMRALRSKKTLEDEQSYVIDFGESKDHFVEGVDELAMVRRLKGLLTTPEESERASRQQVFKTIDAKAALLRERNKRWHDAYERAHTLSLNNPAAGLLLAWNSTGALDAAWVEDFFIIAKDLMKQGSVKREEVASFIESRKNKTSPHGARVIKDCLQWLSLP